MQAKVTNVWGGPKISGLLPCCALAVNTEYSVLLWNWFLLALLTMTHSNFLFLNPLNSVEFQQMVEWSLIKPALMSVWQKGNVLPTDLIKTLQTGCVWLFFILLKIPCKTSPPNLKSWFIAIRKIQTQEKKSLSKGLVSTTQLLQKKTSDRYCLTQKPVSLPRGKSVFDTQIWISPCFPLTWDCSLLGAAVQISKWKKGWIATNTPRMGRPCSVVHLAAAGCSTWHWWKKNCELCIIMYFYYFQLSPKWRHIFKIKHSCFSPISPDLPSSCHRLGTSRNHIPSEILRSSGIVSFCPLASVFSLWVGRCGHNFLSKFSSEILEGVGEVLQLLVSEF